MNEADNNFAEPDGLYTSIVPIGQWLDETTLRTGLIKSTFDGFQAAIGATEDELLERVLHDTVVAAALETGSIEGLYKPTTGVTLSLIEGVISAAEAVDSTTEGRTEESRLVDGQQEAYQLALNIVTDDRPFTEVLIREIHAAVCAGQDTYRVQTQLGWEDRPLPKGTYKTHANHVLQADGSLHAYCPVRDVQREMANFVANVRAEEFLRSPAISQSAYIHHAFTHVHPFSDGNGRTARVLASIPLIGAYRTPLVVLADRNADYRAAQAQADVGNSQRFLSLIEEMVVDLLQLLTQRLRLLGPSTSQTQQLEHLIETRRSNAENYASAAERLEALVEDVVRERLDQLDLPDSVDRSVSGGSGGQAVPDGWAARPAVLVARVSVPDLTQSDQVTAMFKVAVKKVDDDQPLMVAAFPGDGDNLLLRVNEVLPRPKQAFRLRLNTWIDRNLQAMPDRLAAVIGGGG